MIETHTYTDFSREMYSEVHALRIPANVTIELTNRCPLECAHCYNNLPMSDAKARRTELTTEEHIRVLDELAELGCLWLLFSGGEILARSDFFEIYRHAISKGFLVTLFTNGTLITERVANALAALPPFMIEITLYGRTKDTYESLTGIPGSFERCLRGIHLLMERKLPLKLKTVAVTINKHEVWAMKRFSEELGLEFKFDPMINPRIDCSNSPLAVRLTPAEIVALDLEDPKRVADWRRLATSFEPAELLEGEQPQLYDCGGGVDSFALDPYGNMTICVLSHVDKYNIRNGGVREGWQQFLLGVRQKPAKRVNKCTRCILNALCGSCPAQNELDNGDPESPVDFLCRTAHLRAEVFGVEVRAHGECEYCVGGSHRAKIEHGLEEVRARSGGQAILPVVTETDGRDHLSSTGCGPGSCGSCSLH
ncbi:MAG TPA: radical SAM protein [Thermoanaerobaculia bacterium]|nr:radical SAM protein [Thermoanaerobaculia bacterium]